MSVRTRLVEALFKEIHGPRNGAFEIINDPDFEYLTGVLVPKDLTLDPIQEPADLDESKKIPSGVDNIYSRPLADLDDHEEDNPFDLEASIFDKPLDPRTRAKSLGISFVLTSEKGPSIDLCVTFARYEKAGSGQWQRNPYAFYEYSIDVTKQWNSKSVRAFPAGAGLYIIPTKISFTSWKVSIYFVNETSLDVPYRYSKDQLIFQPQIRIVCSDQTHLSHMTDPETEEDLSVMYRNRRTYARGHMCSASWRNPQLPSKGDGEVNIFEWTDSKALPEDVAIHFRDPDVKSEYVPYYSILQHQAEKEIQAQKLASLFDPNDLKKILDPIPDGYEQWIESQKLQIPPDKTIQKILSENIGKCEMSLKRIRSAINLLNTNETARLAFCFMNAAMDLQFRWESDKKGKTNEILSWYRFQLVFILQCLEGIVNRSHPDREVCDLLWYPTGGGKTEAYLALVAFTLAYRRLQPKNDSEVSDGGTAVISRYTLRLLTIQQFRRSLKVIAACDKLRVTSWKPDGYVGNSASLWGYTRFSIGLWVGQKVTPNKLEESSSPDEIRLGAIGSLKGKRAFFDTEHREVIDYSEPAQILNCPVCDSVLAVPSHQSQELTEPGMNKYSINWIFRSNNFPDIDFRVMNAQGFRIDESETSIKKLPMPDYYVITVVYSYHSIHLDPEKIDSWWNNHVSKAVGIRPDNLCSSRASRPGYFLKYGRATSAYDFEIRCPNVKCPLNAIEWFEEIPSDTSKKQYTHIDEPFRKPDKENVSFGMPISAYTIDAQIYRHCPSFIISTVDKFARLPYEPYASSIFGNVDSFDSLLGYFRKKIGPDSEIRKLGYQINVKPFLPPSLIIQDELHLIDGPLGSITGLYETAIDSLCTTKDGTRPKYIASTATIKDSEDQVKSLFDREVAIFPSPGSTVDENYYNPSHESSLHSTDKPGRLYIGICTPGKTLLPIVRIWSALLRETQLIRDENEYDDSELDSFWTLVGYFNSLKELAIARAIYSGTEIRGRIGPNEKGVPIRELPGDQALELSGQSSSLNLHTKLKRIEKDRSFDVDALFTTSMFGTGIDISRLNLMVMHGQPKNTSSYIQATGRVGRKRGGLVITVLRSSRPRDLNHYEFFVGYHRAVHRFVEPVSVYPFSSEAVSRALGPVAVSLLRNSYHVKGTLVSDGWSKESKSGKKTSHNITSGSREMGKLRSNPEIKRIIELVEERSQSQPEYRRPEKESIGKTMKGMFDRWENFAKHFPNDLLYWEQTFSGIPVHPVVLGSPQYEEDRSVFKNSPTSAREVESTCGFGDEVW